jgi:hypothetical protein
MAASEIPRHEWIRFFDEFSREHEGWITTVEVLGSDLGDQEEATGLPLVGISADLKDRENIIEVMVGNRPDAHITHTITSPKRVLIKPPEEEAHEAIEIESEDGTITLVRFRHIPPDEVERQLND